ncbi:MAG: CDP-glycerol glycerophosphotransferase family protein [Oscillospiraceae bacterium]|nr:CDP-glycerol glycerophosphotransferase family protein [Oscillospiraceae bacterium]
MTYRERLYSRIESICLSLWRRRRLRPVVLCASLRHGGFEENFADLWEALPPQKRFYTETPLAVLPRPVKRLKLLRQLCCAKVIITDDDLLTLCPWFQPREEQKIIQIWHGPGACKRFLRTDPLWLAMGLPLPEHNYDAVIVSSDFVRKPFAESFGVPAERVLPLGIPRTDTVLRYGKDPEGKAYAWAPTYRPEKRLELPPITGDLRAGESITEKGQYLYIDTAVLITDYASVLFEAVLLGLPIVFYQPEEQHAPLVFFEPADWPGEIVTRPEEILPACRRARANVPAYGAFIAKYLSACDGSSATRVAALAVGWLE